MPLDFIFEKATSSYMFSSYNTNEKLTEKVQTGKGDPNMYEGNTFFVIDNIFGATEPEKVEQQIYPNLANPDRKVGTNDLRKAKSAKYSYYIDQSRNKDINEEAYLGFEDHLHKAVAEWLASTKTANFFVYTE